MKFWFWQKHKRKTIVLLKRRTSFLELPVLKPEAASKPRRIANYR
jgi:hypothetical protein